jgi:hypothetical protein
MLVDQGDFNLICQGFGKNGGEFQAAESGPENDYALFHQMCRIA